VTAEVFLDTAYAIALAAVSDQLHARAIALRDQLKISGTRIVTTKAVLLEIGNGLSKRRYRSTAVQILSAIANDPTVAVVPLSNDIYAKGFELFQNRTDKEWGLIDCVSFVVMTERGLTEALAHDEHFEQAGFKALLRTNSE